MGMTPLHILCANPAANKDMIKQLYSENIKAVAARGNVNNMQPWHMYAVNKDKWFRMCIDNEYAAVQKRNNMLPWHIYIVKKDTQFCMLNEHKDKYGRIISTTMTNTARMILSNEFDVDKLTESNLDIDIYDGDVSDHDWVLVVWKAWDCKCGNRTIDMYVHG